MKTAVSNVAPGQVVKFHWEPCIVLEHRTAGTLLVTAAQIKSSFGSTNNFAVSSLREYLNGDFADALTDGHADELITREVDLTALNGSKGYGSCECKVAPLTFDEIRRFHGMLPNPESWEWSATPWSTPCVDEDDTWVMGLNTNGNVTDYDCTNTSWSRPAFLIPSKYAVEVDGGLDQYTTNELIAEINRRVRVNGGTIESNQGGIYGRQTQRNGPGLFEGSGRDVAGDGEHGQIVCGGAGGSGGPAPLPGGQGKGGGPQMIVENIRTMCQERGITVSELELECDLSRGTILHWSKRGGPGSFRSVCRIADYFGVSLDALAGRDTGGRT